MADSRSATRKTRTGASPSRWPARSRRGGPGRELDHRDPSTHAVDGEHEARAEHVGEVGDVRGDVTTRHVHVVELLEHVAREGTPRSSDVTAMCDHRAFEPRCACSRGARPQCPEDRGHGGYRNGDHRDPRVGRPGDHGTEAARAFYAGLFGWDIQVSPDPQYGGYGIAKTGDQDAAGIGGRSRPTSRRRGRCTSAPTTSRRSRRRR